MKKFTSATFVSCFAMLALHSCALPNANNPNAGFPQSITETHTKTSIVAPPSYGVANMPSGAIYHPPAQTQMQNYPVQPQTQFILVPTNSVPSVQAVSGTP